MLIVSILPEAEPAELKLALRAHHIGASTCLVDVDPTLRTWLSYKKLSQLVGTMIPLLIDHLKEL